MRTDETERAGPADAEGLPPLRPGRRLVAAVVALALAAGGISLAVAAFRGGGTSPPVAPTLPANGPIALATGDPPRLAVVDPDGTAVRPVTTGKEPDPRAEQSGYSEESFPQWSPDGTQIAFVRWYVPGTSLCLINLDGSGFRVLVSDLDGGQLAWSPDGTTFAYSSWRDHTIHLVDADGTNNRVLPGLPEVPDGAPPNWLPTWSPDSTAIAFTSKDLWTVRADGTGLTRITDLPEGQFAFDPSWSPDGSRIVFSIGAWAGEGGGGAQEGGRLYVVDEDGSNLTPISPQGQFWWAPDWSPDGRYVVALEATPPDSGDPNDWVSNGVYVMAADGTDIHLLGEKTLWGGPSWGPAQSGQTAGPSPASATQGSAFDIAFGDGAVWALTCDSGCSGDRRESIGSALRIDPDSGQVLASVSLANPSKIAVGEGGVWVISFWDDTLTRIDPATAQVVETINLELPFAVCDSCPGAEARAFAPYDVAVGEGGVWVDTARGILARIDPATDRVQDMIRLPAAEPADVAVGEGAVWVGMDLLGVYRIDPANDQVAAQIAVDDSADRRLAVGQVVLGGGSVWASGGWGRRTTDTEGHEIYVSVPDAAIARIDPSTDRPVALMPVGDSPGLMAFDGDALWLWSGDSSLERIDPIGGTVTATADAPAAGHFVAVGDGAGWIEMPDGTFRKVTLPSG